jgi:hypothetical protein
LFPLLFLPNFFNTTAVLLSISHKILREILPQISNDIRKGARNGTERNGTERNGTERNGTERNGTERRLALNLNILMCNDISQYK